MPTEDAVPQFHLFYVRKDDSEVILKKIAAMIQ